MIENELAFSTIRFLDLSRQKVPTHGFRELIVHQANPHTNSLSLVSFQENAFFLSKIYVLHFLLIHTFRQPY